MCTLAPPQCTSPARAARFTLTAPARCASPPPSRLLACHTQLAKDNEYLVKHIMASLPSLAERVQQIRTGKAATNVHDNDRNLEKSQASCGRATGAAGALLAVASPDAAMQSLERHRTAPEPAASQLPRRQTEQSHCVYPHAHAQHAGPRRPMHTASYGVRTLSPASP